PRLRRLRAVARPPHVQAGINPQQPLVGYLDTRNGARSHLYSRVATSRRPCRSDPPIGRTLKRFNEALLTAVVQLEPRDASAARLLVEMQNTLVPPTKKAPTYRGWSASGGH